MNNHDDHIADALRGLPSRPQRHVDEIESRARSIRFRRHAAIAGLAAAMTAAIAVPSAGLIGSGPSPNVAPGAPVPATTDGSPACEGWEASMGGDFLHLHDVPESLRLLWADSAAPPPDEAHAVDYRDAEEVIGRRWPDDCEIADQPAAEEETESVAVSVYDIADNIVRRQTSVLGPDEGPTGTLEVPDRVLETAAGSVAIGAPTAGTVEAIWPATEDGYWIARIQGAMSDDELVSLAESTRLVDGRIDLGEWPGLSDAVVRHSSDRAHDGRDLGKSIDYFVKAGLTTLHVDFDRADPGDWEQIVWDQVGLGSEFVDVDGVPALKTTNGALTWLTRDGHLVHLFTPRDHIEIARTIVPVSADEERLVEVWQDDRDELP